MAELQGEAKQQYVASLFSRITRRYDLMNDLMTAGLHRVWKSRTARLAMRNRSGMALDVAGGTGDLGLALARQPNVEQSVVLDLLPGMIARARLKMVAAGLERVTTCVVGDALNLPFPDSAFACCTAGFSLRNMPNLEGIKKALEEMARVVEPGGCVAVLELTPLSRGLITSALNWYFHQVVPVMGKLVTGDRGAYEYLPQSVDLFLGPGELAAMFEETGLVRVGYQVMGFGAVAVHWGEKPLCHTNLCLADP